MSANSPKSKRIVDIQQEEGYLYRGAVKIGRVIASIEIWQVFVDTGTSEIPFTKSANISGTSLENHPLDLRKGDNLMLYLENGEKWKILITRCGKSSGDFDAINTRNIP